MTRPTRTVCTSQKAPMPTAAPKTPLPAATATKEPMAVANPNWAALNSILIRTGFCRRMTIRTPRAVAGTHQVPGANTNAADSAASVRATIQCCLPICSLMVHISATATAATSAGNAHQEIDPQPTTDMTTTVATSSTQEKTCTRVSVLLPPLMLRHLHRLPTARCPTPVLPSDSNPTDSNPTGSKPSGWNPNDWSPSPRSPSGSSRTTVQQTHR